MSALVAEGRTDAESHGPAVHIWPRRDPRRRLDLIATQFTERAGVGLAGTR